MLPKNNRLNKDQDIKRLLATGRSFFLPQFVFRYKKNNEPKSRITFVVSNRVSKKAVERNQLKRRLRNASKELLEKLTEKHDVVIIAKPSSLKLTFPEIKKQLQFALDKIMISKK